jgi:putative DNA primase/helicase
LSEINILRNNHNKWADFWRYDVGVNVIPADTRNKMTNEAWSKWQDEPIPEDQYNEWKSNGSFNNGIAIILGKIFHNKARSDLYLVGIDADNKKAIEEICTYRGKRASLQQLTKWTLVEQHSDAPEKAHIYIYSQKPFAKKSSDKRSDATFNTKLENNDIPAIEVKSDGQHGIFFCTPSIHKNGCPYQILDTRILF